jgi:hypothetical protein
LNSLLTLQESELELHGEMVAHEKALARLEEVTGGQLGRTTAVSSSEATGKKERENQSIKTVVHR